MIRKLRLENRMKILQANGKDNGNIIRKLKRQLRKLNGENNE